MTTIEQSAARHPTAVDFVQGGTEPVPLRLQPTLAQRIIGPDRHASRMGGVAVFAFFFVLYLGLGIWLNLDRNWIWGDAASRVADGSYVVYSRYPHLGAIGFVWNPLPSLLDIPLVVFRDLWAPLMTRGVAAVVVTAAFSAGAVVEVRGILVDRGLPRIPRLIITYAFAFHPMVLLYAANGMTEMDQVFMILWLVRALMRWIWNDATASLMWAGIALAMAYLVRYESAAVAGGATLFVLGVSYWRSKAETPKQRRADAITDGLVVALPFVVAFVAWAATSWLLSGQAFAQFQSQYGNSNLVKTVSGSTGSGGINALLGKSIYLPPRDMLGLEILLPAIVIVALVQGVRRRDLTPLLLLATFGAALVFFTVAYVGKFTFPWLRYFFLAVPLAVLLVGSLWPDIRSPNTVAPTRLQGWTALVLPIVLLVPAMPVGLWSMLNQNIGFQEYPLQSILDPTGHPAIDYSYLQGPWAQDQVAEYINRLNLPAGSVLMDTFDGWQIFLAAHDNKTYVVTSDYDFIRDLNSPAEFHIQYILVPGPVAGWSTDAVTQRYPTMWANGAGIGNEVLYAPPVGTQPGWKLYRVKPVPSQVTRIP